MGTVLIFKGNDVKALEILLQSLKMSETINELQLRVRILIHISDVYSDQGDEKKSLEYTLKARDIAFSIQDDYRLSQSTLDIGDSYEKLNQLDSARFFAEQRYKLASKKNYTDLIGVALINLGNIYSKMKLPVVAMDNYRKSIPYLVQTNQDDEVCESTLGMAKLFHQLKQDDSCLYYARLSYDIAQKGGFTKYVISASNFLADYYKQHHGVDSAYAYLSVVIAAKDSMYSQEKIREIQNLSFDETVRQQEITAQRKNAEENHIRNLQLLAIGIFIPIFFLIVIFLSRTKVKGRVVEFLGILSLLLFFEFITDLIYPFVINLTNDSAIWEMLILVIVAALLEPLNYRMEHWVKERLVHKPVHKPIPVMVESIPNEGE